MDDTALQTNPRNNSTTNGWLGLDELLCDTPVRLGKNTASSECPYCGTPFKRHQAGNLHLYAPHDDCCATRAALQACRFARHAHDHKLPAEDREEHEEFFARMLQRTRDLNPRKRPTVSDLYGRAFSERALLERGPILCAENLLRLLKEHAWAPEDARL